MVKPKFMRQRKPKVHKQLKWLRVYEDHKVIKFPVSVIKNVGRQRFFYAFTCQVCGKSAELWIELPDWPKTHSVIYKKQYGLCNFDARRFGLIW